HTHTTCQYKIPHARAPGVQGAALAPLQKKTSSVTAPCFCLNKRKYGVFASYSAKKICFMMKIALQNKISMAYYINRVYN
ncbi:MAG: hypothetical protein IKC89_07410, partial [Lentisphaeria bacterium]|nr:hypothetical protein [Lentisphaeria bacterium]